MNRQELDALLCKNGSRVECYKAEILDKCGIKRFDVALTDGTINCDADAQIKRSGNVTFKRDSRIDFINDRLKIYMGIKVGETLKYHSLGVFLMVKNKTILDTTTVQLLDLATLIQQASVIDTKVFASGTLYTDVLKYFLISCGIINNNIQSSTLAIPMDLMVDDSKNKLEWFNYIAQQINYTELQVDADGIFTSKKYELPSPSNVKHTYKTNQFSIIVGEAEIDMDNWKIPNVIKVVSSNDKQNLYSVYENKDPTDKYSTVDRGQIYAKYKVDNIANQQELDLYVQKLAFKARQITQNVVVNTINIPTHGVADVIELQHKDLIGIFVESGWTLTLKSGATMQHKLKRVINI